MATNSLAHNAQITLADFNARNGGNPLSIEVCVKGGGRVLFLQTPDGSYVGTPTLPRGTRSRNTISIDDRIYVHGYAGLNFLMGGTRHNPVPDEKLFEVKLEIRTAVTAACIEYGRAEVESNPHRVLDEMQALAYLPIEEGELTKEDLTALALLNMPEYLVELMDVMGVRPVITPKSLLDGGHIHARSSEVYFTHGSTKEDWAAKDVRKLVQVTNLGAGAKRILQHLGVTPHFHPQRSRRAGNDR